MIPAEVPNALTVDVEDWYQVSAFDEVLPRARWDAMESRVERSTARVLEVLDRHGVKGTFFVLGCVARRHPALVAEIAAAGHEVASHGDSHRRVGTLDPAAFAAELARAEAALLAAAGVRPTAFRAPSFSIVRASAWAWRVLLERGYRVSSSVFPVRHDRYAFPEFPRHPVRLVDEAGRALVEVPMTTLRLLGRNWPVAGGGWMRALPPAVMRAAFRRANAEGLFAVLYLHPWELDPGQPVLAAAPWRRRWRHRLNLGRMAARLDALLGRFPFTTLAGALAAHVKARGGALPEIPLARLCSGGLGAAPAPNPLPAGGAGRP